MAFERRRGFLLAEVLLGMAVFAVFAAAIAATMISGQENTILGGDRTRGAYIAERAIEGTRAIRDASFSSVTAGTHGVAVNASGKWTFSGSVVTLSGGYLSNVAVTSHGTGLLLSAQTRWKHGYNRSGSVVLNAELSDWRSAGTVGDWSGLTLQGSATPGGTPDFTDVLVTGNHALVTGTVSGGGNGLYVYDVSDLANPTRVNSSFNLGYDGYQMAVRGKTLYVLTSHAAGEVKAYDISSLPALTYKASYDLHGSARGRSVRVDGKLLYVGATRSLNAGEHEFYLLDVGNSGSIVFKSGLDDPDGGSADMALAGTAAYLAVDHDAGELHVVNVANSGSLAFATGSPSNISGTEDAYSVAVTGTAALVGRQRGTGIQELVLYRIPASGGAPASGGPWYREMSGSVMGVSADASSCYAFAAVRQRANSLQVLRVKDFSLSQLATYTLTTTGDYGRELWYDAPKDRVFFLSNRTLYIFQPGASAGSC